jgi:transposase
MPGHLQVEWQETVDELKALYKAQRDVQGRTRVQALWYLRQGHTVNAVAERIGTHARTIQDWVAWYRGGGVAEVLRHQHGGRRDTTTRMTCDQAEELVSLAEQGKIRTIGDGVEWAQAQGVTYTYWGMRHVFERLRLKKKVPRPRNPQASAVEQEAWKKGA